MENHGAGAADVEIETALLDPAGERVASGRKGASIAAGGEGEVDQAFTVAKPQRWDIKTPRLYRAVGTVHAGGEAVDSVETPFGTGNNLAP